MVRAHVLKGYKNTHQIKLILRSSSFFRNKCLLVARTSEIDLPEGLDRKDMTANA